MRKKLRSYFLPIVVLLLVQNKITYGQAPQMMSYQAIMRNSSNNLVLNTIVNIRISILQGADTGKAVFVETHMTRTNAFGLATVTIGTGTPIIGKFSTIDWGSSNYFIKSETDPEGGTNFSIVGTAQLLSVPYALYSSVSGTSTQAQGKSAFDIWRIIPGNENKSVDEFIKSLKGESAFDIWKSQPGNNNKTLVDFFNSLKGDKGASGKSVFEDWLSVSVNANKNFNDFLATIRGPKGDSGANGLSAYDLWKSMPENRAKDTTDFLNTLKGQPGQSTFDLWRSQPGNGNKTLSDFLDANGSLGRAIFEEWRKLSGNAGKTFDDFLNSMKGGKGDIGGIGQSAFQVWKSMPGNALKDSTEFIKALKGDAGKSAFDLWKTLPGNETKDSAAFLNNIKGVDGKSALELWKGLPGNEGKDTTDFLLAIKGKDGKSTLDIWKGLPGNAAKDTSDFLQAVKGADGKSALDIWKGLAGNAAKDTSDFLQAIKGDAGKSAFDLWKALPGNDTKDSTDFVLSIKGDTGKSAFEVWKSVAGNEAKDTTDYLAAIKGDQGIGVDFRGTFADTTAYKTAGNTVSQNKAYYNSTDKKSYIFSDSTWKVFAQDAGAGSISFNVDRPITRGGLPVTGMNLGAGGKTVAEFLEQIFFPSVAATPPAITSFTTGSTTFPYSTWKNWAGFSKTINFSYTINNVSKTDLTDDKDITSIKLLNGPTVLASAIPDNVANPQSGTFNNIAFTNPTGTPTVDYTSIYTLEVKDAQPQTVTQALTLTMQKAKKMTYLAPTLTPGTTTYEYDVADQNITLNWNINPGDESILDIKVGGVSTGSTAATGSQTVVFKTPAHGGAPSQSFSLLAKGNLYGDGATLNSPTVSWANMLYRGTFTSPVFEPGEPGFTFTDSDIKSLQNNQLGGDWKSPAGYSFTFGNTPQYLVFAYPDDGTTPNVEVYDSNFGQWQAYPPSQLYIFTRPNFTNQKGYNGTNYKVVFITQPYVNTTQKFRLS